MARDIDRPHWKHITNSEGKPSLLAPIALSEDYDGCFGNTDEAMRIVENVAAENTHLTVSEIRHARAAVERRMLPFSTVEFIERELQTAGEGKTWTDDLRPHIMERAAESHHQERLLARGAEAVFAVAQELAMPEVVVTHGAVAPPGGPKQEWAAIEWQTVKVKMTPELQEKPLVVTHDSTKAEEFRRWYDPGMRAFLLPEDAWLDEQPLYAESIVHVDDKRSALRDWPNDIPLYAIHYLPESDEDVRQTQIKGELPRGVPIARGMAHVAELLMAFYEKIA
jgi:hypothetical protein